MEHMAVFGVFYLLFTITLGLLLAILIDRRVFGESLLKAIYLFPSAASFVVTGMIWQWIMNPELGLQAAMQGLGMTWFHFDWATNSRLAIFAIVLAGVWQGSGLVMAITLASLRGIDADIWSASRVDGIPTWKVYWHIIIPAIRPTILTTALLLSLSVVRVYELVISLTHGGPGTATDMPAIFISDYLFSRQNIALASAGSTVLLLSVIVLAGAYYLIRHLVENHGAPT